MYTWTSRIIVAALLAAGCTGNIDTIRTGSGDGTGSGSGSGSGNGSGSGSGSGGSGSGDPSTDPTVCVPGIPKTSQLPRLTVTQFENTVFDLTGLTGTSSTLAPDTENVDKRAWDGYTTTAQLIASQIMADANAKAKVLPCTEDSLACIQQFVSTFGERAFRRPLTAEEKTRFETLYNSRAEITPTGSFDDAVQLILESFFLSPSFLIRGETAEVADAADSTRYVLSPYEVASRLSYMLLGTMPDQGLFDAAAANALSTPEQIREQAIRLLGDPRARTRVAAFHERYLHAGPGTRWADYQRDETLYPAFSTALVPQLAQETQRFLDYIVFEQGGSFKDLVTSPIAFVNSSLAPLYGLNAADFGADLTMVTLDAATRPGVFTRAGFLASHAVYNRPSPILRGAFLQKYVLCTVIGSPPPGAEGTELPEVSPTASNRERVDAQTAPIECAGCHHSLINPTGYALEVFDAVGGYQVNDQFSGTAANTAATVIIGDETIDVTGPAQLMDAIANSDEANLCYARNWVQVAYERGLTNEDSCVAEELAGKLTAGGYRVLDLIADLTQADSFRYRAVPEVTP